eukprot:scaffold3180_cov399-Prasinococcus_capsulatus_cf.AAC.13
MGAEAAPSAVVPRCRLRPGPTGGEPQAALVYRRAARGGGRLVTCGADDARTSTARVRPSIDRPERWSGLFRLFDPPAGRHERSLKVSSCLPASALDTAPETQRYTKVLQVTSYKQRRGRSWLP